MRLPPCRRCRGVMFQDHGRETFCVVCEWVNYGGPTLSPHVDQRRDAAWNSRNARQSMTVAAPYLSKWGRQHRSVI